MLILCSSNVIAKKIMNLKVFATFLYLNCLISLSSGEPIRRRTSEPILLDPETIPKAFTNITDNLDKKDEFVFLNSSYVDLKNNSYQINQNFSSDDDEKPLYEIHIPVRPRKIITIYNGNLTREYSNASTIGKVRDRLLSRDTRSAPGCDVPRHLKHSTLHCTVYGYKTECEQSCIWGHHLHRGVRHRSICCRNGRWQSDGYHLNVYRMDCHAFVDCSVKLHTAGKKKCYTNYVSKPTNCEISCYSSGQYGQVYTCNLHGHWHPRLPHCARPGYGHEHGHLPRYRIIPSPVYWPGQYSGYWNRFGKYNWNKRHFHYHRHDHHGLGDNHIGNIGAGNSNFGMGVGSSGGSIMGGADSDGCSEDQPSGSIMGGADSDGCSEDQPSGSIMGGADSDGCSEDDQPGGVGGEWSRDHDRDHNSGSIEGGADSECSEDDYPGGNIEGGADSECSEDDYPGGNIEGGADSECSEDDYPGGNIEGGADSSDDCYSDDDKSAGEGSNGDDCEDDNYPPGRIHRNPGFGVSGDDSSSSRDRAGEGGGYGNDEECE